MPSLEKQHSTRQCYTHSRKALSQPCAGFCWPAPRTKLYGSPPWYTDSAQNLFGNLCEKSSPSLFWLEPFWPKSFCLNSRLTAFVGAPTMGFRRTTLAFLLVAQVVQAARLNRKTNSDSPKPVAQGDACANENDRAVIRGRYDTLRSDLHSCATSCLFKGRSCSKPCVQEYGFGSGCSDCLLDFGECGRSKCFFQCIPIASAAETAHAGPPTTAGDSPRCKQCVEERCMPALVSCSGLAAGEIPP